MKGKISDRVKKKEFIYKRYKYSWNEIEELGEKPIVVP